MQGIHTFDRRKCVRRTASVILVWSGVIATLLTGCSQKSGVEEEIPVAVETFVAQKGDLTVYRKYTGEAQPKQEIFITPKVPAKVSEIYFLPGDKVTAGDILFALDDSDIASQLDQAAAGVAAAQTNYEKMRGSLKEQQILQAETAYHSAQIAYEDAKKNYERMEVLFAEGAISKQALEQAESGVKQARQQYDSALKNYNLTKDSIVGENINAAKAQLDQATAAYEAVRSQVGDMVVTSDIDGVVGMSTLKVGQTAMNTAPVMSIIDNSAVEIEIGVTDDMVGFISRADRCALFTAGSGEETITGEVMSVSPARSLQTKLHAIRISADNAAGKITPGELLDVKIKTQSASGVIVAPVDAVVTEYDKTYVYVLKEDSRVEKREVTTGLFSDDEIAVTSGLAEGETIVVKGMDNLFEGSLVEVVN